MYAWYHCIMFCLTTLRFAWQPNWFHYEGITLEAIRPIFDPNLLLYFYTSMTQPANQPKIQPQSQPTIGDGGGGGVTHYVIVMGRLSGIDPSFFFKALGKI